jgi:hypothetical protein
MFKHYQLKNGFIGKIKNVKWEIFFYYCQDYLTSIQCYNGDLRFFDTNNNPILISNNKNHRSILNDCYVQIENNLPQINLLLNRHHACLEFVENLKYDPKKC